MLKVYQNTDNNVYVTFTESMIDPFNWILLKFKNDLNLDVEYFTLLKDNISTNPRIDHYIMAEVEISDQPDPEASQINFKYDGYYEYWAYELDKDEVWDADEPAIIKLIENGRCFVVGENNLLTNSPDLTVYE